ncbi:MAG TPA: PDR/VanB family oxidoreductase [Hyphomicrobiaceae bacterium]
MQGDSLRVKVSSVSDHGAEIKAYDIVAEQGGLLPQFTAGAHVDVVLGDRLVRSYSICSSPDDRSHYRLCVARDANGRGGSIYFHENVRRGDSLTISPPKNLFRLNESAEHSVLIAGGIGITPLLSMAHRLHVIGRSWEIHYAARSRTAAALLDEVEDFLKAGISVNVYFSQDVDGCRLDMARVVNAAAASTHLYCCGPARMLTAFAQASAGRPRETIHVERFSPQAAPATAGGFTVVLRKRNQSFYIPPGETILQVLRKNGVHVSSACEEGTCGSCETVVIGGRPDHRDSILNETERMSGETMMICCSGSLDEELILDL